MRNLSNVTIRDYHQLSCGCCTGKAVGAGRTDQCVCFHHRDEPNGIPVNRCSQHLIMSNRCIHCGGGPADHHYGPDGPGSGFAYRNMTLYCPARDTTYTPPPSQAALESAERVASGKAW